MSAYSKAKQGIAAKQVKFGLKGGGKVPRRVKKDHGGLVEDDLSPASPPPPPSPSQSTLDKMKDAIVQGKITPAEGGGPYKPSWYKKGGKVKKGPKK